MAPLPVRRDVIEKSSSSVQDLQGHYDIIIVGGGTAGMVLASRLSEDTKLSVLMLEAGDNKLEDPRITTPGLALATWFDPEFDWCSATVPQESLNGRAMALPRGKTLGGSSAINMGLIAFPSRSDIDAWAALGNRGWDWAAMQPYYRKFHTYEPPSAEVRDKLALGDYLDDALQGKSGPVKVAFGNAQGPMEMAWPQSMHHLGLRATQDPLSGLLVGGHSNPGTINPKTLARSHAGSAYYHQEVHERSNLHVVTGALVEKVILGPTPSGNGGAQARAVRFTNKEGRKQIVEAMKEIIVTSGAVGSPQILERSGIGSHEILKKHGIEVLVDNAGVGENLQDHVTSVISYEVADGMPSADAFRDPAVAQAAMAMHVQGQPGPLSSSTFSSAFISTRDVGQQQQSQAQGREREAQMVEEALSKTPTTTTEQTFERGYKQQHALLASRLASPAGDTSSAHFFMGPFQMNTGAGVSPQTYMAPLNAANFLTLLTALSHPFSRGSVHLTSGSDPLAPPLIDPRYLSHPLDRALATRNVQFLQTIAQTPPFAQGLLKQGGQRIPAEAADVSTPAAAAALLGLSTTNFHLVGTCAMMPRESGGVVDERLRVYGVRGLRVVDASVIPLIPRGNVMSSVYAVAERAADLIKEDLASGGKREGGVDNGGQRSWGRSKL